MIRQAIFTVFFLSVFGSWANERVEAQDTRKGRTGAVATTIRISPEILVSRDHPSLHVELMAAANPRNSLNLLVGAITMTGPDGGPASKTYASLDGGYSWHDSRFPEQRQYGGGDPQVVFTPEGTALFATLALAPDQEGRSRGFLHVYRSQDGGISWSDADDLMYSWDHPQMVVDHTTGPYSGRIYMGVLHGYPVYRVSVFRSEDDGRTWIGPAEAANGGGELGINVDTPTVLSDGALVVFYKDFEFKPERRAEGQTNSVWSVISSDGGLTFSEPRLIATRQFNGEGGYGGFPQFTSDPFSQEFRDRLYGAWVEYQGEEPRIVVTWSGDRGRTWSEPQPIDPAMPSGTFQFQPAIAVNREGVVAVTWFDTRDQEGTDSFHQYFSASVDGGVSWLPPERVSTSPSFQNAPGNIGFSPSAWRTQENSLRISLLSPGARWKTGGDYMGLTVDSEGRFRPFWTDTRYGSYQIMTCIVEVAESSVSDPGPGEEDLDLSAEVDLIFDPSRFDSETQTLSVPVRMRNSGERTIHGPLKLIVRGFGSGLGEELVEFSPTVLNATNGLSGKGAEFDFSPALGSERVLRPGAISGPIEILLRLVDPLQNPDLHVEVRGGG